MSSQTYHTPLRLWTLLLGISLIPLLLIGLSNLGVSSIMFTVFSAVHFLIFFYLLYLTLGYLCQLLKPRSPLEAFSALLVAGIVLAVFLLGTLPVTAGDALIHHLAVPKLWIEAGRIYYIDFHSWSNYPMLLNLAYTALMQTGLVELCSYYHAAYYLILAALAASFLQSQNRSDKECMTAAVLCLGTPLCIRLASIPLVDLGLAVFCFLSLILIIEASQTKSSKYFLFAGAALGLALSTKYNAIVAAIVLAAALLSSLNSTEMRKSRILKSIVYYALGSFIIFLPWMLKNYSWTGNPIYPLYNSLFGVNSGASLGSLNPIEHRILIYKETWVDFITLPIRMLFSGADLKPANFDGVLHPGLIFGFIGIAACWKKSWGKSLSVFSVLYFLLATTLAVPRARYLAPILASWICLSSIGINYALCFLSKSASDLSLSLLFFCYLSYLCFYTYQLSHRRLLGSYFVDGLTKEQYLKLTVPDYELITWINNNLPKEAKIYLLNTPNRFYYYDRAVTNSGHNSTAGIVSIMRDTNSAKAMADKFKTDSITHLMANLPKTVETMDSTLDGTERKIWNEFQTQNLKPLVKSGNTAIWEITNGG